MADYQQASQIYVQVEYDAPSFQKASQEYVQVEYGAVPSIQKVSQIFVQAEYEPGVDDGLASGGFVFGGVAIAIGSLTSPGGIVFGGAGDVSVPGNYQVDGLSRGGLVFGGQASEQWQAIPNNMVAVKGGTYRIAGALYTLANTMTYPGLGDIAVLITLSDPPATPLTYRYDLLSIDATGTITVTEGAEAAPPVMPATPSNEVKLNHVLRYYGQTSIVQGDIGSLYKAPQLSKLTAVITDDELAWAELSTTIIVGVYDQYGAVYYGSAVINASFLSGNGTISPLSASGVGSFSFTYTRGHTSGDISPFIQFTSSTGIMTIAIITLLDVDGNRMF